MVLAGWAYYAPVEISNPNSYDLLDFQVLITLTADNFDFTKANADGSDIRFTLSDGGTLIPHWIESWDSTNQIAKIWVKVPSIPAGGTTTILMWCGNPGAVDASDGDAVFEFFDDFSDGTIDTTKWTNNGISISTTDGVPAPSAFVADTYKYMYANAIPDITKDYVIEFYAKTGDLNDFFFFCDETGVGQMIRLETRSGYSSGFTSTTSWTSWNAPSGIPTATANNWYHIKINIVGNTATGTIEGVGSGTFTITRNGGYIGFQSDGLSAGDYWDTIIIRKYADQEPTYTVGALTYSNTTIISATLTTINVSKALETFTGDGSTATFTVLNKPIIPKVRVWLDGVELVEGTDFTVDYTNGTITFATAPASGANIEILYFYGTIDIVPNATVNITDSAGNIITSTTTDAKGDYSVEVPQSITLYAVADTTDFDAKTEFKIE